MPRINLCPFMEGAIAEVLEAMCFISVEGTDADEKQFQLSWIYSELDFTGDINGTFGVAVPPSTAATIAANFLGEEEVGLIPEVIGETICELTNMVCGTLLAHVNSKSIFVLSPPRLSSRRVFPNDQCEFIYRMYALDEGFIHAWVEMKAIA